MRKNAYTLGREMIWSNAARLYWRPSSRRASSERPLSRKSFATKTLDQQPRELPELKLDHLSRMTDSTGMFQHAILTVPNFAEGYCTDDNARAFILTVLLEELAGGDGSARERWPRPTPRSCNHAFDPATRRFRNS